MQTNDPPLADRLANITAPTLIIWGDHDRVLHVSSADLFRKGIKSSEVMIYPRFRTHAPGRKCGGLR
jgi:pimeloyl-ACP methyl ester carboxylesterase